LRLSFEKNSLPYVDVNKFEINWVKWISQGHLRYTAFTRLQ